VQGGIVVSFASRVVELLIEWQARHRLTDQAMAALLRVSQSYWTRVRSKASGPGERVLTGCAWALPDLLRQAIDEVEEARAAELKGFGEAAEAMPV